ncbi:MAG: DUF3137 domain-containing protein [Hyphomonas sp.]|uniref:DUF3137 domain-containing protein n=1 Tax=Hyphomonas sp. TaxID=87 RepID=UPI0034A00261
MSMTWYEIEAQPGFFGATERAAREISPLLERVRLDPIDTKRQQKIFSRYMTAAFFSFAASFMTLEFLLPGGGVWQVLRFILFPVLFIGWIGLAFFLMRRRLAKLFAEGQARLGVKAEAMTRLTAPLGITYVPAPGGAPKGLEWLSKQDWAPATLREATAKLNAVGGMDQAVDIVLRSGLLIAPHVHVIGTPEQKARYNDQISGMRAIEDGFEGTRAGLAFSMFEWVENVSDAADIFHLVILLEAPLRLHGVTQLRARKTGWPGDAGLAPMQDVDLGPRAFDALYRLRASDQVEARAIFNPAVIERVIALSHGGKFRAVAQGENLVFDFASEDNRFHLIDLVTGAWSEDTIRKTHADLAEALALVDTLGHAFMLAPRSDASAP